MMHPKPTQKTTQQSELEDFLRSGKTQNGILSIDTNEREILRRLNMASSLVTSPLLKVLEDGRAPVKFRVLYEKTDAHPVYPVIGKRYISFMLPSNSDPISVTNCDLKNRLEDIVDWLGTVPSSVQQPLKSIKGGIPRMIRAQAMPPPKTQVGVLPQVSPPPFSETYVFRFGEENAFGISPMSAVNSLQRQEVYVRTCSRKKALRPTEWVELCQAS